MKTYLAEVLGTFLLVFIGTASIATGGLAGAFPLGQETVGLAFGLGLVAAAYAIGPISGAHLNPAVTLGVFLSGRMPAKDVVPYWIAQIIGGIIASVAVWLILMGAVDGSAANYGPTTWDPGKFTVWAPFITEVIATFVFVTVILGVTSGKHITVIAGLGIGLTLTALHFAFIPVSGNSLNPARSIGPALFSGGAAISQLWLYIVAPLIGGAIAGVIAKTGVWEKD